MREAPQKGRRIELNEDSARWLTSAAGLAAVEALTAAVVTGEDELTLATRARKRVEDPRCAAAATAAAVARVRARPRWPQADRLLFTRRGLEEASDPEVAEWRAAALLERHGGREPHVTDLTAGLGGDTIALARAGARVTAVERDAARAVLLAHNLAASGVTAEVVVADALEVDVPPGGCVVADPARRPAGRRASHLDAHEPPVTALLERHARNAMALVLAPGVDPDDPGLGGQPVEVEYVQLGNQLTEATVWLGALREADVQARATLLPGPHGRSRGQRGDTLPVAEPGGYLVEVVPAAVRARVHDELGREIGAWRLSEHRALLSTAARPPDSPWYQSRRIEATLPARAPALRHWLHDRDEQPIEVVLHGVEADPTDWWRELGRPPRGPQGRRIELVRRRDDTIAVVTDARTAR